MTFLKTLYRIFVPNSRAVKSAIAFFFIFILGASFITVSYVGNLAIMTNYLLHKDEVTAKFCVNKDKPEMHCNGKCYLHKQLEKEHHKDKKPNPVNFVRADFHLICKKPAKFSFVDFSQTRRVSPPFQQRETNGYLATLLRPPIFA